MQAPYLWIGLWDPDTSDEGLLAACLASLEAQGARTTRATSDEGVEHAQFSGLPAFGPSDAELVVEPARHEGGPGGLIQIVVSAAYFDEHPSLKPAKAWGRFRGALGQLLEAVRPLLTVCPVEFSVDELADPPPDTAELLFQTGWVNPTRLDDRRRRRMEEALANGPRSDLAGGWWWSAIPELDPAGTGAEDAEEFAASVYAAWVGQSPARPTEQVAWPTEMPTGLPELWFWSADHDESELLGRVAQWAGARGHPQEAVELGPNGMPGWFPVVVDLSTAPSVSAWLEELRAAVASVSPSWAGLLPESGIAVPGLTPDIPSTGAINNVWVDDAWIADRGKDLAVALAGAHTERVASGTLYVTDPELLDGETMADWCYDPGQRWDHVVDAAAVLAARARATRT